MSDRQKLNEMKQFMKIAEGAWQLPRSKEDFDALDALLKANIPNLEFQDKIYNILGADSLFDLLDKLYPTDTDAAQVTITWMKLQRKAPHSDFPNIWNTFKLSQREDSPMNEGDPLDAQNFGTEDEWAEEYGAQDAAINFAGDCKTCDGSGTDNGTECDDCYGTGEIPEGYLDEDEDERGVMCGVCSGGRRTGYGSDCPNCGGEGYVEKERTDEIGFDNWTTGTSTATDKVEREKDGSIFDFIKKGDHVYIMVERHTIAFHPDVKTGSTGKEKAWVEVTEVNHDERWLQVSDRSNRTTEKVYPDKEYVEFYDFEKEVAARKKAKLGEVGEVKHDDYGAAPVYENHPDDECDRCCGLGNHPGRAGEACPECHGTGKCPNFDEGIDLGSVVENILQEYPGQPKKFYDEDDLGPIAQGKSGILKDLGNELDLDVIDVPMSDYEDDLGPIAQGKSDIMIDAGAEDVPMSDYEDEFIDPEYKDSEIGFRFD